MSDRAQTAVRPTLRSDGRRFEWRLRRLTSALAGPLLICAAVLVTLNAFAFRGLLSSEHPDILPFWVPTWCYLGKSLAAGHIPAWNPAVMGGIPFAADPQSGWLYVPPMVLFSTLPCAVAIRAFIVLQPILSGLGMYWFLGSEGTSRPAATVGGLALALPVAGSFYVLSLPFAGMFAWTPLLLASASRYLRSPSWAGRLMWLTLTALCWGQLAAAHLSHGLVLGTGALLVFLASRLTDEVRAGNRSLRAGLAAAGLMILAFPLVNLALLLPRLVYLPTTTFGLGYLRLDALSASLGSPSAEKVLTAGLSPIFPLKLIRSPGLYAGALALALSFVGFWNRRKRHLAVAFGLYGAVCYVLSLDAVVHRLGPALGSSIVGSFYTHFPVRMVLGIFLAVPVLAALGVDAWRESTPAGMRVLMVLPAVVVWGVLAAASGTLDEGFVLPAVAAGVGTLVLVAVAKRPRRLLLLIPLALAAELVANDLGVDRPMFQASAYLQPGPIARYLMERDGGRYLSLAPRRWGMPGYHVLQREFDWGLMATQRSMVFHLEEAQGYNPAQLVRYWTFVRAADPKPIRYNAAGFVRADPMVLDLLQVTYLIQPGSDLPAIPGEVPVAKEGRWVLYRLADPPPRASVLTSWSVATSPWAALQEVLAPGFDPDQQVVLERAPHPRTPSGAFPRGTATFRWEGAQSARIVVDAPAPAVVLVRNAYAPHWQAVVDGHPAPVLPADYLLQEVPVPAGHHVIHLSYHDPTIGYGLTTSAVVLALLLAAAGLLAVRERRERARRIG